MIRVTLNRMLHYGSLLSSDEAVDGAADGEPVK